MSNNASCSYVNFKNYNYSSDDTVRVPIEESLIVKGYYTPSEYIPSNYNSLTGGVLTPLCNKYFNISTGYGGARIQK